RAKGTNILCTLDTQIITTRAGFTRCLITRDVYSVNGKVLLLEKGSKIIGEQTTAMLQGQARVGILWNEVTTPKGVT
ncbi:TrbI/VirB10 family protein, partial [Kingella kingae]|uniref:TrbI/VirB10 family protein n=1 Tax=Kingella kingae TaxID=504 RepID=UPI00254D2D35